jgi:hypothetical protein
MTPEQLTDFHDWLKSALPCDEKQIVEDAERCRKALPKTYAHFPDGPAAVSAAMRELEGKRLVRKEGTEWRWLSGETVKVEPQLTMF